LKLRPGVANGVIVVGERPHPDRPAVAEGPHVREGVVYLGTARFPAAALAHRCEHVSGEFFHLEQFDGEVVGGVVAFVEPLEYGLRAAKASTVVVTWMSGAHNAWMAQRSRALIAA
jgi:hypothetical protein